MRSSAPAPSSRQPARPPAWRTTGLLSLLALGVSLLALGVAGPLAVLVLLGASTASGQTARLGLPPGAHDEGVAVAAGPAAAAAAGDQPGRLALRRGCQWGQPGRNPYQGSVRQALEAAGLPEDAIAQIEAQHRSGRRSGRLEISRQGIRHTSDGRVFPARGMALTYGMTLCQDATVNFPRGHVELADFYEARDSQGRSHAVMVPDVCGNVTVLGAAASRSVGGRVAGVSATLKRRAQALAELADVLDASEADTARAAAAAASPGDAAVAGDPAVRQRSPAWPLLLAWHGAPLIDDGVRPGASAPAPMVALAVVTDAVLPPGVAASVARGISRVSGTAGRALEAVASATGGAGGRAGTGRAGSTGVQPVPEPGSLSISLLALGLLAWGRATRRRRAAAA